MKSTLDIERFSFMVKNKRGNRKLQEVADEIGDISVPTLSRIERGNLPDIDTYLRICEWLEVSPEEFALTSGATRKTSKKEIIYHLRADRTLPSEVAEGLIQMIEFAYNKLK